MNTMSVVIPKRLDQSLKVEHNQLTICTENIAMCTIETVLNHLVTK